MDASTLTRPWPHSRRTDGSRGHRSFHQLGALRRWRGLSNKGELVDSCRFWPSSSDCPFVSTELTPPRRRRMSAFEARIQWVSATPSNLAGSVVSLRMTHNGLRRAAYSITLSARARIGSSLFDMASIERLLADHLQGLTQRFAGNMNRWRCHVNTSGEGDVEIQDELERHGDREGT